MNVWHALIVFFAALVADITWARYTIATSSVKPIPAMGWAVGIILLGVVSIDAYIDSRWYVVPAALGAAIGTYVTVRHQQRSDERSKGVG